MTTTKKRIGRPTTTDPRVHRYNFKLTTEENIRFKQMLCKAGLEHNRSRFIVKRIFAEEFVVVKRDPSKVQFIARLNDFYFQFQKLGNNYNQIVKVINAGFCPGTGSSTAYRTPRYPFPWQNSDSIWGCHDRSHRDTDTLHSPNSIFPIKYLTFPKRLWYKYDSIIAILHVKVKYFIYNIYFFSKYE